MAEVFIKEGDFVYTASRTEVSLENWAFETNTQNEGKIYPVYFDIVKSEEIEK